MCSDGQQFRLMEEEGGGGVINNKIGGELSKSLPWSKSGHTSQIVQSPTLRGAG